MEAIARELLDLYRFREKAAGTPSRLTAIGSASWRPRFPMKKPSTSSRPSVDVKADMERPRPMDRLVCGDVGYGKTEVALRAAFKAVMDGKQVAVLVPTTMLAQQHYNTFRERMQAFPVRIGVLSRFHSQRRPAEGGGRHRGGHHRHRHRHASPAAEGRALQNLDCW